MNHRPATIRGPFLQGAGDTLAVLDAAAPRQLSRSVERRAGLGALALPALGIAGALVIGTAVAEGLGLYMLALLVGASAFLVGIRDWRTSIKLLLVFLPYSGLFIIAAYPNNGVTPLLKDLLFVIPAYVGFLGAVLFRRQSTALPGFPVGLAALFAVLVLTQLANPSQPGFVVGLIGTKVWLMYIPLALLGYHLIDSKRDLRLVLEIMCIAAIVPCAVGIVEAVLIAAGKSSVVYGWYGAAAGAATQGFAVVGSGIHRIPSTFSSVTQYYLFVLSTIAVAYAYWRGFFATNRTAAKLGLAIFLLALVAALLSGARGAILAAPAMVLLMLLLDGAAARSWIWLGLAALVALAAAATAFQTNVAGLVGDVFSHGVGQFSLATIKGFRQAFDHTVLGLGTGVDTEAAHYGGSGDVHALIGGHVAESYWVKSVLELGLLGLIVLVCFLGTVLVRTVRTNVRLRDPQLRSVSSGLVALLAALVFYNFKGSYFDFDPTNVLFWLFLGIVLKLPKLDRGEPEGELG